MVSSSFGSSELWREEDDEWAAALMPDKSPTDVDEDVVFLDVVCAIFSGGEASYSGSSTKGHDEKRCERDGFAGVIYQGEEMLWSGSEKTTFTSCSRWGSCYQRPI
jgi:hypothetical protein